MQTKFQQAALLAEAGFFVFRLKPNAKTPAFFGWQVEATRDPDKLKSFFDNNRDFNIGIYTEKYEEPESGFSTALAVVDVDTKPGKNGATTMKALDAMGCDFPPTFTQITATGGQHLIYSHDVALASGANKLGEHVDLKSAGAYIVGAGSTIDGIPYTIDLKSGLQAIPSWIPTRCRPPLPNSAHASNLSDDSAQAVSRAIQAASLIEAHSGGRNDTAFKLGCQIRDLGLSEPMTEEILQGWNGYNVSPPLAPEEITAVTGFVYKHAKLPQGNKSPQAEFESVPYDPKIDDVAKNKGIYYLLPENIETTLDTYPLVEDYLDQDTVSLWYGPSNAGKTFVAMDVAYHIATGTAWNGHYVTKGSVVYLSAEGGRSASNRVQALKSHYGVEKFPFALVPCPVNLFNSTTQLKAFTTIIEQIEINTGPVRLIVIDTLNRVMAGGDENSAPDMGEFIKTMTFIKERFKAHVAIIHHPGKDATKGARGHSSLRAAVDTEIEVKDGRITTTKQRDMAFAKSLGYSLKIITLGVNIRGKDVTSCAVTYFDAGANDDFKLEPRDTVVLMALKAAKTKHTIGDKENVVSTAVWKQLCEDFNISSVSGAKPWPKNERSFDKAFCRSCDRLVGFGMVEEVEQNQWCLS